MKMIASALCMLLLCASASLAQTDTPAPEPGAAPPADQGPGVPPGTPPPPGMPPAAAPAPAPAPASGDQITLKSGSVIKDVQVLRKSPKGYDVQVSEGITFFIPRGQVVEIKFDDIDPARQPKKPAQPDKQQALLGEELEAQTFEKLRQPLPEACLKAVKTDLVEVLAKISTETGVKIEVSEPVKNMPAPERSWDLDLPAGTTLTSLLQSDLPKRFASLAVIYKYDTLIVTTKEAAASQEAAPQDAAEGDPAPAEEKIADKPATAGEQAPTEQ